MILESKKEWTKYEKYKLMNNNIRDQRGGERSEELRGGTEEKCQWCDIAILPAFAEITEIVA